MLKNYYNLKFSNPIAIVKKPKKEINPKRMQRKIKKTVQEKGIGTKAQQALKLDYENKKQKERLNQRKIVKIKKLEFEKDSKRKLKEKGH
ncbi:YjdF family protein [Clostridium botulinum]|nr:YjdF family protein [Clostridium botulinum]